MTETTDTTVNYPSSPPALLQIATCLGVVAGIYCISARDEGNQMCGRGGGQTPPSSRRSSEREGSTVNQRGPVVQFYVRPLWLQLCQEGRKCVSRRRQKGNRGQSWEGNGVALQLRSLFVFRENDRPSDFILRSRIFSAANEASVLWALKRVPWKLTGRYYCLTSSGEVNSCQILTPTCLFGDQPTPSPSPRCLRDCETFTPLAPPPPSASRSLQTSEERSVCR